MSNAATCALDDPQYRKQVQGLIDMTAALRGTPSYPAVFSTEPDSIINKSRAAKYVNLLREIDSWLVCAPLATLEDMAQSFEHFHNEIEKVLSHLDEANADQQRAA